MRLNVLVAIRRCDAHGARPRLARGATLRGGLHAQSGKTDRRAAIDAVSIDDPRGETA
jgi:hypothetical protein